MNKPFDNSPNPFLQLNLSIEEIVEAYIFFSDADHEAQLLVIEALDKSYNVRDLINFR